jgi:hypothetical protein
LPIRFAVTAFCTRREHCLRAVEAQRTRQLPEPLIPFSCAGDD